MSNQITEKQKEEAKSNLAQIAFFIVIVVVAVMAILGLYIFVVEGLINGNLQRGWEMMYG